MNIKKVCVGTYIERYYSGAPCLNCTNAVCKAYGGRCFWYQIKKMFGRRRINSFTYLVVNYKVLKKGDIWILQVHLLAYKEVTKSEESIGWDIG